MTSLLDCLVTHAASVQAALFIAVIVACWMVEAVVAGVRGRKQHRAGINGLFASVALPVQIGMATFLLMAVSCSSSHQWGLVYWLPGHESPWIRYGLMFVVLDLLDWVYHWAMHHIPVFWRFHLVHHTDTDIDASTTVREHPGETLVRNGFLVVWVFLCGASAEVLVLRQTVESVANILAHTSFRLPGRWASVLGAVFITPNLHHVHHHHQRPYTDSNYGDVFSVWDRLFGTLRTLAREDTVFGLDAIAGPRDPPFAVALALPFHGQVGATREAA